MPQKPITILGKVLRRAAATRGGGSALPGLVVEKLDPKFLKRTLSQLPHGVVVVSGTNGKTTTTKMIVALLESQGLRVFTNRSGSNFTRGIVASLLGEVNLDGKLDADIAVLELDEAHAVHFVRVVPPRYTLLLNVMRDQLDRFGEIDKTARLLQIIASHTTHGVVINREDPRLLPIAKTLPSNIEVGYFGLHPDMRSLFPNDDELYSKSKKIQELSDPESNDVVLNSLENNTAAFTYDKKKIKLTLRLSGVYNVFNAAAALAFVHMICADKRNDVALLKALAKVTPAFGRGERFMIGGKPLELVLVKNPAGFRLSLSSFHAKDTSTMLAINDNYADGRDMSWLWDVDFSSLKEHGVASISGVRAYDMALRLQYDQIEVTHVDPNLQRALKYFLHTHPEKPKRIYCTYTAMLSLRRLLKSYTKVEAIS